ncbi:MAG: septum formation protein Maf [Clostridia bacterium]|nr:septum formation protein Maf [Clostridia bacterium]
MKPIILASASPRRQEICTQLGIPFTVCPAESEASMDLALPLEEAVMAVARSKAEAVAADHLGETVLGSDTIVTIEGKILGKPKSAEDAAAMLRLLSGRIHHVLTGVWVVGENGDADGFTETAAVQFAELTDEDIAAYVATGEPMDKAGAYGIQGIGARYITALMGDFYTVMGLPAAVWRFLRDRFGKKW